VKNSKKKNENTKSKYLSLESVAYSEINKVKDLLERIAALQFSPGDILKIQNETFIPIGIFSKDLTVLEAVVRFLKQTKSNREIAKLIKRDERNISNIFRNAVKKFSPSRGDNDLAFPCSIFNSKLSALESLVEYLKEQRSLSYHEIAKLLQRDDRTIWTVYSRAKKKLSKESG
jgi:hypothetical protein